MRIRFRISKLELIQGFFFKGLLVSANIIDLLEEYQVIANT